MEEIQYRLVVNVKGSDEEFEFIGTMDEVNLRKAVLGDLILKMKLEDLDKVAQIR